MSLWVCMHRLCDQRLPHLPFPCACTVFMQPHWDCPLEPPVGVSPADVGIGQWQPGLSFGETSERTMDECERLGKGGVMRQLWSLLLARHVAGKEKNATDYSKYCLICYPRALSDARSCLLSSFGRLQGRQRWCTGWGGTGPSWPGSSSAAQAAGASCCEAAAGSIPRPPCDSCGAVVRPMKWSESESRQQPAG